MIELIRLGSKINSYVVDAESDDKNAKRTTNCKTKRRLNFEGYKNKIIKLC